MNRLPACALLLGACGGSDAHWYQRFAGKPLYVQSVSSSSDASTITSTASDPSDMKVAASKSFALDLTEKPSRYDAQVTAVASLAPSFLLVAGGSTTAFADVNFALDLESAAQGPCGIECLDVLGILGDATVSAQVRPKGNDLVFSQLTGNGTAGITLFPTLTIDTLVVGPTAQPFSAPCPAGVTTDNPPTVCTALGEYCSTNDELGEVARCIGCEGDLHWETDEVAVDCSGMQ